MNEAQLIHAAKTAQRINDKQDVANAKTHIPVISWNRVDNRNGKGFRVNLVCTGFTFPITVWDRDAKAIGAALAAAPVNDNGQHVIEVIINAKQGASRTIEGIEVPGFYNVTASAAGVTSDLGAFA